MPGNGPQLTLVVLLIVAFLVVVGGLGRDGGGVPSSSTPTSQGPSRQPPGDQPPADQDREDEADDARPDQGRPDRAGSADGPAACPRPCLLPGGGRRVFADRRFLVAYYGTAGTGVLGVLGEAGPDETVPRLLRAARPFGRPGERVQPVFELIVTVADRGPGPDGDYSHDIDRERVARYVRAARRHGVLLLLDLQPGRSGFLEVARRWEWALRQPWVGLALDPEWRMQRRQVPGRAIGWVGADEVNRTGAWLSRLVRRHDLPEKLFVLHQFRTSMIPDLQRVRARRGLAVVQHVDGFGTPGQKLATYRALARQSRPIRGHVTMGFKLFYDEDRRLMSAARVRAIRPPVRFVSYQ